MRKLLWVGLMLLIALGGGAWLWQTYGVFIKIVPRVPFDPARAPPAPDYSRADHWAALPTTRDGADLVPRGTGGHDAQRQAEADVFFIHPTAFLERSWNAPIGVGGRTAAILDWILAGNASAFNGCCRVYAPHYREATLASFFTPGEDGLRAIELAYQDVRAAFRHFVEHHNQGRPFLIAGHSQGALHAYRLLREEIDNNPLRERLVAAYAIGYPYPAALFERDFVNMKLCSAPLQTACLITWETWAEGSEQKFFPIPLWQAERLRHATRGLGRRLCVNPLSWQSDAERVEADRHLGAVAMPPFPPRGRWLASSYAWDPIAELERPSPHHTHARCDDNGLYVAEQSDPPYASMFVEGNYHAHDYHLFYMNIRENAAARTRAWLEAHRGE
jgi:hypothetical protein